MEVLDIHLCKMDLRSFVIMALHPITKTLKKKPDSAFDRGRYFHHAPSLAHAALIGAGEIRNKRHGCQRRTLDDFALVYLVAGSGFFSTATQTCQVTPGDLLVLFPGIEHSYGPTVPGAWDEYWLMCTGAVFAGLQATGLLDPQRPVWRPGLPSALINQFDALVTARQAGAGAARSAQVALAEEAAFGAETHLLITRLAQADAAGAPARATWVIEACAALDADLERPVDLRRVAVRCELTYDAFRKAFTIAVGLPPARYRLERRIERAKALLTAGATPAGVAATLGFCDVYFFTRQFRALTGTTPGRFRGALAAQAPGLRRGMAPSTTQRQG